MGWGGAAVSPGPTSASRTLCAPRAVREVPPANHQIAWPPSIPNYPGRIILLNYFFCARLATELVARAGSAPAAVPPAPSRRPASPPSRPPPIVSRSANPTSCITYFHISIPRSIFSLNALSSWAAAKRDSLRHIVCLDVVC